MLQLFNIRPDAIARGARQACPHGGHQWRPAYLTGIRFFPSARRCRGIFHGARVRPHSRIFRLPMPSISLDQLMSRFGITAPALPLTDLQLDSRRGRSRLSLRGRSEVIRWMAGVSSNRRWLGSDRRAALRRMGNSSLLRPRSLHRHAGSARPPLQAVARPLLRSSGRNCSLGGYLGTSGKTTPCWWRTGAPAGRQGPG